MKSTGKKLKEFTKRLSKPILTITKAGLIIALMSCASTPKKQNDGKDIFFPPFETENGKILIEYNEKDDTVKMPFQLFKSIVIYIDTLND